MISIPGFKMLERIYESPSSLVYRAIRLQDDRPVILKALREDYPSPEEISRYRREYETTRNLNLEGVIKPLGLEKYANRPLLIFEDFGGESLDRLLKSETFTLKEILGIAVGVAGILGELHAANLIHKDIKPSNIVLNQTDGHLKLIDFGSAVTLSRRALEIKTPGRLSGTLAYMSPEQTGRLNRTVDWRTDFYSFGVTLYEMFTGRLPFAAADELEIVHAHIARKPRSPRELNEEIPDVLSNIVMKLLSKSPEDRYQSAAGIKADLEQCLDRLRSSGRIEPFSLSLRDIFDRFHLPQDLYGRKREMDTLLEAFNRVCRGKKEMMLVCGPSGIGKTALVREIQIPVAERGGRFIYGRFDPFERNVPYSAVTAAFRDLVEQVLTESEESLDRWRERLLAALGPNGQVIIDLISGVELIIGRQPEVPALEPVAAQNRLRFVFQNFIRVFCRPEHPLVLFLDFLSGIDPASLALLELMMTDEGTDFLFLIGAYRESDVDPKHILIKARDALAREGAKIHRIELGPLSMEDVTQLVADTLDSTLEIAAPLARIVMEKTGGNPFFVSEFLTSLHNEGILGFDLVNQCWQWDSARVQAREISDNVVELMARRIKQFPTETQNILKLASVIGYLFEIKMLKAVYERPLGETAAGALKDALEEGLIMPTGDDVEAGVFRFAHDRIRQAAYSLIPETERPSVHLQVGRLILKNTPADSQEEKIFDLAGQINMGAELIEDEAQKYELAELNLRAGRRAKAYAAWEASLNYLNAGLELLGTDSWETHYGLNLALHEEAAEAAYLNLDFNRMEQLAGTVIARARTLRDQVRVYSAKIQACAAREQHHEAVGIALDVAGRLGVDYPEKPTRLRLLWALARAKLALLGKRIEDLADLPEVDRDRFPGMEEAMGLLNRAGASMYFTTPELMALFAISSPSMAIKAGVSDTSPMGLVAYGMICCGVVGDIESGYRFGRAGLKLAKRFPETESRVAYMFNTHLIWWKEHARESVAPLGEGFQSNLEKGDFETAGFCASFFCVLQLDAGFELAGLERTLAAQIEAVRPLGQETSLYILKMLAQVVANLRGQAEDPRRLSGEFFDEEKMQHQFSESGEKTVLGGLHFSKASLCYTFGDYARALEHAEKAETFLDALLSTTTAAMFPSLDSLIRLALYSEAAPALRKRYLRKTATNQKKLKKWAKYAPMNFMHKYNLVEAERCRVLGRVAEAMDLYDRAIEGARENEYLNDQAKANELAAGFYLARGNVHVARAYMQEARYCYLGWGAVANVDHLDENYPELLGGTPAAARAGTSETESTVTSTTSDSRISLDLASVMKATGALSQEIVLERLLEKLMTVVIESAGAEKGFLVMETDGRLLVEAEGTVGGEDVTIRQSIPVDSSPDLSSAIVHYVARTHENVLLNDAATEGKFAADPWIRKHKPRSVLCIPLINKGKLSGILYLKNDLTTGVFTTERLEVLNTLCSQAAISLENAQLYEQLADYSHTLEEIIAALNVAQEVQQSLLPQRSPKEEHLDIAGRSLYCDETGGDYYDFIQLPGQGANQLAVVVGDVSGHGVSSALLMAGVRAYLRGRVIQPGSAAEIITDVNRLVTADTAETGQFMTLFFLMVDADVGRLTWVRAGHDPAFVYSPSSDEIRELRGQGIAMGVDEDWQYRDYTEFVEPGQIVILSTDGVWEAHNSDGEMFGKDRFKDVIRKNADRGAEGICKAVFEAVTKFRGEAPQEDDVTLVVLKSS